MALSGVSAASPQTNPQNDPRLQFMQLVKSVNSGNLTGAQQAFAQLTQSLGGSTQNPNNSSSSSDPFSQALNAIGQALQSGDLAGAQQALASLQQQAQAGRGHHHHGHRHGGGPAAGPQSAAAPAASPSPGSSGNSVDLTA